MKSTGTTSWFHRDIPSARSPYTSTTWEDTKRKSVIESQHLGFDNKRKVNNIVTRKARIRHMTSAIPQEEEEAHQSTVWQRQSSGSAVTDFQSVWQEAEADSCSKPSMSLPTNTWLPAAHSQLQGWAHVALGHASPSDPLVQFKSQQCCFLCSYCQLTAHIRHWNESNHFKKK